MNERFFVSTSKGESGTTPAKGERGTHNGDDEQDGESDETDDDRLKVGRGRPPTSSGSEPSSTSARIGRGRWAGEEAAGCRRSGRWRGAGGPGGEEDGHGGLGKVFLDEM